MTGGHPRVAGAAGLAAALLAAQGAAAQEGGPIVVSPRPELEWAQLYDIDLSLTLEWTQLVNSIDPAIGPEQTDTENRLREILDIRTTGFLGHPNLVEFDLGGRFWPEQRWLDFETTAQSSQLNQTLYDWDVRGLFLKESGLPFIIYSRQSTSDIDQLFGGTFQNVFTESGALVDIRSDTFPTKLQIFRRTIDQTDAFLVQDFNINQDTVLGDGRIEMGQDQRMSWDFEVDDINESGNLFVPQSFTRTEANAEYTLEFNEDRNSLRARGRFYDETGDLELTQFTAGARLRLHHSDTLNSWYDYSFDSVNRPDQDQVSQTGTATVNHQLFDSLTTFATAGFNIFDIPTADFSSDEIFGNFDTEYRKEIPGGRLSAGLDGFVSFADQSELGAPVDVVDRLFIFDAADLIVINQRNVIAGSIVVTDVTGIITYVVGADYLVMTFPDRTDIRRIPGGAIAPGQAVLVDYTIGPEPGGSTDTYGLGVDFRYTIERGLLAGISLYGGYFRQDENRSIITSGFPENDFSDLLYGVEYDIWKLYFRAERRHRDSTLASFVQTRLEAQYTDNFGRGSALVLSALYQDIDRPDQLARTQTTTFSGQWNQVVSDYLRIALTLQYQLVDDSVGLNSEAFEQQFDLVWRYAQTEFYAQVRNSIRNTDADDTWFQKVIVGIRREF